MESAGQGEQEKAVPAESIPSSEQSVGQTAQAQAHTAEGIVESVDVAGSQITIAHEAVESVGWPEMTMPFAVDDPRHLEGLEPGTRITFTFHQGNAGQYVVTDIRRE